jgi:hypothetical protein
VSGLLTLAELEARLAHAQQCLSLLLISEHRDPQAIAEAAELVRRSEERALALAGEPVGGETGTGR